jgi:hypothetical protein
VPSGGGWAALSGGGRAALSGGGRAALSGGGWAALSGGGRAALSGGGRAALSGGGRAVLSGGGPPVATSGRPRAARETGCGGWPGDGALLRRALCPGQVADRGGARSPLRADACHALSRAPDGCVGWPHDGALRRTMRGGQVADAVRSQISVAKGCVPAARTAVAGP